MTSESFETFLSKQSRTNSTKIGSAEDFSKALQAMLKTGKLSLNLLE
jgi:hypothetical protein